MNDATPAPRSYPVGFLLGLAIAFGFAVVIRFLPAELFLARGWLVVAFVIVAAVAPPTVLVVWSLARLLGIDRVVTMAGAAAGAMTFDGLAIAFVPALYGQTGAALTGVAAVLLFAFATLLVAMHVMTPRPVAA